MRPDWVSLALSLPPSETLAGVLHWRLGSNGAAVAMGPASVDPRSARDATELRDASAIQRGRGLIG
jgi:hypothetical protein